MTVPRLVFSERDERQRWTAASDLELLEGLRQDSERALDELVRRKTPALLQVAFRVLGDLEEARDVVQVSFLRMWEHRSRFDARWSPNTWIYRIVTNLCLDQLRRKKTRREEHAIIVDHSGDEVDMLASVSDNRSFSNPAKELDRKLLAERIHAALVKLTPRERMVFELKHYQGLRLRTIGEMLNTTEETAKNTLFRATKKLRTQLAGLR